LISVVTAGKKITAGSFAKFPFFAAVFTAAIQETCKIVGMSPIFRCLGCGQFIERSLTAYKKHKGQIFCSTCNDRKQIEVAADSKKA
jgi:uncharacterized Zn finger protein